MITAVTKDIMCTYICNSSLAPSFKSSFTYTAMFSHTAILQIRYRTICKISIPLSTIIKYCSTSVYTVQYNVFIVIVGQLCT